MTSRGKPAIILVEALLLLSVYACAMWAVYRISIARGASTTAAVAAALISVPASASSLLLATSITLKTLDRRRGALIAESRENVEAALARHVGGGNQLAVLRRISAEFPEGFEAGLHDLLSSLSGFRRQRLGEVAVATGWVERWSRTLRRGTLAERRRAVTALRLVPHPSARAELRRALKDADPDVRVEASRALIADANREEALRICAFALEQSAFVRALLADDLQRHSMLLAEEAFPPTLAAADPEKQIAALSLLAGWRRFLPAPAVGRLARTGASEVRIAALEALPYALDRVEAGPVLLEALENEDPEIRRVAAHSCGICGLRESRHLLLRNLRAASTQDRASAEALAAAEALARLGRDSWSELEREATQGVGAALEALQRARLQ